MSSQKWIGLFVAVGLALGVLCFGSADEGEGVQPRRVPAGSTGPGSTSGAVVSPVLAGEGVRGGAARQVLAEGSADLERAFDRGDASTLVTGRARVPTALVAAYARRNRFRSVSFEALENGQAVPPAEGDDETSVEFSMLRRLDVAATRPGAELGRVGVMNGSRASTTARFRVGAPELEWRRFDVEGGVFEVQLEPVEGEVELWIHALKGGFARIPLPPPVDGRIELGDVLLGEPPIVTSGRVESTTGAPVAGRLEVLGPDGGIEFSLPTEGGGFSFRSFDLGRPAMREARFERQGAFIDTTTVATLGIGRTDHCIVVPAAVELRYSFAELGGEPWRVVLHEVAGREAVALGAREFGVVHRQDVAAGKALDLFVLGPESDQILAYRRVEPQADGARVELGALGEGPGEPVLVRIVDRGGRSPLEANVQVRGPGGALLTRFEAVDGVADLTVAREAWGAVFVIASCRGPEKASLVTGLGSTRYGLACLDGSEIVVRLELDAFPAPPYW